PQPRAAPRPGDDPPRDLLARLPAGDALRRIIEALDQQGVLALAAKLFGAAAGPSCDQVKDIQNQEATSRYIQSDGQRTTMGMAEQCSSLYPDRCSGTQGW